MKKKPYESLVFKEIGISCYGQEFFLLFAYPMNSCRNRFDRARNELVKVPVEDWLVSDFPVILSHRLALPAGELQTIAVTTFAPHVGNPCPVHIGGADVNTWLNPFICQIASQLLNYVKAE